MSSCQEKITFIGKILVTSLDWIGLDWIDIQIQVSSISVIFRTRNKVHKHKIIR
jgi:hypothetical protein